MTQELFTNVSILAVDAACATFAFLIICTFLWAASQLMFMVVKAVMDR